jgi:hypothetical protein
MDASQYGISFKLLKDFSEIKKITFTATGGG